MTDIQAAIGREQLKRLPEIVAQRRKLGDRYRKLLADIPGVIPPSEPSWARSNWQSYCVRLPEGCDQVKVMQAYARGRRFDAARHHVLSPGTGLRKRTAVVVRQRTRRLRLPAR